MKSILKILSVCLCVFGCPVVDAAEPKVLTIGSEAPKLDIEHWIFDGQGKLPKVTKFESGKVYVVEFWATWCGPCKIGMPHLAELQKKYQSKGLQIIGVSNEPVDTIQQFLAEQTRDSQGKATTFGEVTKVYSLTTDPDGSTDEDYMLAAKQDGIPTAFIIGKDSKIDWIGSPFEMDEVLDAVINDKWDREKYKAEQELLNEIQTTIARLTRNRKFKEAAVAIDGFLGRIEDPSLKFGLYKAKLSILDRAGLAKTDAPAVYKDLFALSEGEPMFVQDVAWTAYEQFVENAIEDKEVIRLAISTMEKNLKDLKGSVRANFLDTLSHLRFAAGDLKGAVAAQQEAVQFADDSQKEEFSEFLKELQSDKK